MVFVNLADNPLVVMTFVTLDLIETNRLNVVEVTVLQPPGHCMLGRFADMIPADAEGDDNVFSGHTSRPTGKKPFLLGG